MMSKRCSRVALRVITALLLPAVVVGCDQGPTVGLVNLAVVAQGTGRDREIRQMEQNFRATREGYQNQLNAIVAESKELGDAATPDQKQDMDLRANTIRQQAAQLEQQFRNGHAQAVNRVRQDVLPYVRDVAAQRGLLLVLLQSEQVLAVDASIDISQDVIAKMSEALGDDQFGATGPPPGPPPSQPLGPGGAPQGATTRPAQAAPAPAEGSAPQPSAPQP